MAPQEPLTDAAMREQLKDGNAVTAARGQAYTSGPNAIAVVRQRATMPGVRDGEIEVFHVSTHPTVC